MLKKFLVFSFCAVCALNLACQSVSDQAGNSATANQNSQAEPITAKPLPSDAPRPEGIPTNSNAALPKGATPTPGIPDPSSIGKTPMPKGTPPIPGIPDEETLRKQMNQMRGNSNAAPPPPPPSAPANTKSASNQTAPPMRRNQKNSNQ